MATVEIPATEPDYEPLPLDVIADSEPDEDAEPDRQWEVVDVSDVSVIEPDELAPLDSERQDGQDGPSLPLHSTRSSVKGVRGCWAVSRKTGGPCGAAAIRGTDYCAAHSGVGVSRDPAAYAPLGQEERRRKAGVRAEMRLALGSIRLDTPRGVLKAKAFAERERLAGRVVSAALADPKLALKLIDAVDPPVQATVSVGIPTDPAQIEGMKLSQLFALAGQLGIEVPAPPGALPPAPA